MATGIRDKVAILGMGCSKFGERWDKEADDLMVEAFEEAIADAGIETNQIEAAWLATAIEEQHVGKSGVPLAVALRLPYIPVTRVENYCASGTEAFRGAVYAVASGAADIALALGVEKLKDTGYGGLPQRGRGALNSMYWPNLSAPGSLRPARRRLSRQAQQRSRRTSSAPWRTSRSRATTTATRNPKAHLTNKITMENVLKAPMIAEPLGLFDCCGVSDGVGLRHRHHAGDRQEPRQEGPDLREGAAALGVERHRGVSTTPGTAATSPPRASPPSAPTRKPASTSRARRST